VIIPQNLELSPSRLLWYYLLILWLVFDMTPTIVMTNQENLKLVPKDSMFWWKIVLTIAMLPGQTGANAIKFIAAALNANNSK